MDFSSKKLSAIVITLNEEKRIADCLRSVSPLADELIVVDSFSSDNTPEICREFGVRLVQNAYSGQVEQKKFALSLTSYTYVLSIDADEVLTPELTGQILRQKKAGFPADGYLMNRRNNYCGKWIRHGGWSPDRKLRLWNKEKAIWAGNNPHDEVIMNDNTKIIRLKGFLLHYAFDSIAEHRVRMVSYARIGAQSLLARGQRFHTHQLWLSPAFKFIRDYIFRMGFLDGKYGWVIAYLSARTKYLKYQELKRLCRNR